MPRLPRRSAPIDPAKRIHPTFPPIPHKTRDGWGIQFSVFTGRIHSNKFRASPRMKVSIAVAFLAKQGLPPADRDVFVNTYTLALAGMAYVIRRILGKLNPRG